MHLTLTHHVIDPTVRAKQKRNADSRFFQLTIDW